MNAAVAERRRARRRDRWSLVAFGAVFVLAFGGALGYAVRADPGPGATGDRLRVVTTTNFLDDTVRRIGGEDVRTVRLMGPGVDPHLYQAKAGDLAQLRQADAVIAIGLFLEGSMERTLEDIARSKPVLFAGEQVPEELLLDPAEGAPSGEEHDPHIWFDPRLWAYVVDAIEAELARIDPANARDYQRRGAAYRERVLGLGEDIRARLGRIPPAHRQLVTSHDAFRYFGRAFGMEVVAIQGISTEEEASTADIGRVAGEVMASGVRSVFLESSVPRQTLEAVLAAVRQRGGEVRIGGELFSDAAGDDGTPEGSYLGMVRANADRLVEGLR
ncbi:metal ABC transporter solute-binding protein, Zn/Mn family [Amycolatopsis cihanbeyliensis]|uniref:Manganese/zinc/iron transport system substrate-binding protein n=1 Tax=Amycolatopsis cihanbeyliensis TaxID=1128664 RepID=A0A542DK24_AMYCI|nr:zinc ABC transporter substrate-binding protein [Amycolatopsis cihanbeyliensis]TQJ03285.1 manganese/zinc/iron transport system substrate-binding protein [Amycolatopsis cihanbeyliensis]